MSESLTGSDMKSRLARFDRWVYRALVRHLAWPNGAGTAIFRARNLVNLLCLRLAQRGFHLDGRPLADQIDAVLSDIGTRQKAGEIVSLWPYMRGAIESHVANNADRLKSLCQELGCHYTHQGTGLSLVEAAGERFANGANRKIRQKARMKDRLESDKLQGELIGKGRITQLSRQAVAKRLQSPAC